MADTSLRQDNPPAVMAHDRDAILDPYQLGIESTAFRALDTGSVDRTSADKFAPDRNSGSPSDLGCNLDDGAHVIFPLSARGNAVSDRSNLQ